MITTVLLLWLAFDLKHFIADFVLQNEYMQGKFRQTGWAAPLALHCLMHALCTLAIVCFVNPSMWWLALLDFTIHFTMDRIKASPRMMGRYKNLCSHDMPTATAEQKRSMKMYWLSLGFDQYVHHLTNLLIAWLLVGG